MTVIDEPKTTWDISVRLVVNGQELLVNADDINDLSFGTPHDVVGVGDARRVVGPAHLNLSLTFKDGKYPTWTDKNEE